MNLIGSIEENYQISVRIFAESVCHCFVLVGANVAMRISSEKGIYYIPLGYQRKNTAEKNIYKLIYILYTLIGKKCLPTMPTMSLTKANGVLFHFV